MEWYQTEFSPRFDAGIAEIEQDMLGFGREQTERYRDAILDRCDALSFSPNRGTAVMVRGQRYRRFSHGGHVIWYRVIEAWRRVLIEAVLRRGRDHRQHL